MKAVGVLCVYLIGIIASSLNVADCATVYERGVGGRDQQIIVDKHNQLRRLISEGRVAGQPRGTNLKHIQYDASLADQAQRISDTCRFAHVKVHDNRWHAVGQNLFAYYSTNYIQGAKWADVIQDWFNEYPHYRYGDRSTNHQNGHYTQIVWANTEFVGCGYTLCKGNWPYEKIYTCNYGPAGNYQGQLPYAT